MSESTGNLKLLLQGSTMMMIQSIVAVVVLLGCPGGASGQGTIPDYDFDWSVIGDVGNAPYQGPPTAKWNGRGQVGYEYRLSRTEVTAIQWMEFVLAYSPFASPEDQTSLDFTGSWILAHSNPLSYTMLPHTVQFPTNMSWRMAARYANWLHNDKAITAEAFENGAYDTSTFSTNPDFTFNDQMTHHPEAKFWIPTLDEYIKGGYYDPNRHGPGQEGWWRYPAMTEVSLIPGPPPKGQTTASAGFQSPWPIDVGMYPDVVTAYGLLDYSGGMREWTEEVHSLYFGRFALGSNLHTLSGGILIEDSIIFTGIWAPPSHTLFEGLRLASAVPALSCVADISPPSGNGVVSIDDLVSLLNGFGLCSAPPAFCDADITPVGGNGEVNIDDLVALLNSFGPCP